MTVPRPRGKRAVVVGGTGMLGPFSAGLVDDGMQVYLPARRDPGFGTWIDADWSDPDAFVAALRRRVTGPVELLVLWSHRPFRPRIARLLSPLVGAATLVVEVVGSSALHSLRAPDSEQPRDDLRTIAGSTLVVLGRAHGNGDGTGGRWLTHAEISEGVRRACRENPTPWLPAVRTIGEL